MQILKWWGYLHSNGKIIVKRWYGDHADYTTDCYENMFVKAVVEPFTANSQEDAYHYVHQQLIKNGKK